MKRKMEFIGLAVTAVLACFISIFLINKQAEAVEIKKIEVETLPIEEAEVEVEIVEVPKSSNLEKAKAIVEGGQEKMYFEDIPLTEEEQIALYSKCKSLHLNYWLMIALLESESSYQADAVSDTGAIGYMQIAPCNWERMKDEYGLDATDSKQNLLCGAVMIKELIDKYGTLTQVIMAYKCGETRAQELIEQGVILDCVEEIAIRAMELDNAH